jgi:flagellar basal body rod protein FlgC
MADPVLGAALSGLKAGSVRVATAASNIANVSSIGRPEGAARALDVVQTSTGFGTAVEVVTRTPPTVRAPDPQDLRGTVEVPNVDVAAELVSVIRAETSFKANAAVVRARDEQLRTLLDVKA